MQHVALLAKQHYAGLRWASFGLWLVPALWLAGEWLTDSLGINPLNRLLHFTGQWAVIMLIVTLAVTPARRALVLLSQTVRASYGKRLSDWNWLVRLRRQFGLYVFFYACLHVAIYIVFDVGPDFETIRDDVLERPFILAGLAAFGLLIPLAATSNRAAMRALGGAWRRLHMLSYPMAVLAIVHFWLQTKLGDTRALPYAAILALLLAARVFAWRRGDRSATVEVKER